MVNTYHMTFYILCGHSSASVNRKQKDDCLFAEETTEHSSNGKKKDKRFSLLGQQGGNVTESNT